MIKFIGDTTLCSYQSRGFDEFRDWEDQQTEWQLDVETNVVDQLPLRKLMTVQFGTNDTQWVLQWEFLTSEQKEILKEILQNKKKVKYIHNAIFEYTILAKYDIILDNVVDTMLQEKILNTGLDTEPGFYSLKELVSRYKGIRLSKEEQTSFERFPYTDSQIEYAARDVMYLQDINNIQYEKLEFYDLLEVRDLENEAVLAFGDIQFNGMLIDKEAWRANYDWAKDLQQKDEEILNEYLRGPLRPIALRLDILKDKDTININWKSPKQRKEIFMHLYPDLEGVTKPIVKKYADNNRDFLLWEYLEGNYAPIEDYLCNIHRDWLIEHGYLIPADSISINWNSTVQRLKLFRTVEPQLDDTSKDSLALTSHPIIRDYINYIDTTKLVTSYGENFLEKYVDVDGYVRTRFNQILNTGRVSSSNPNMQQIPAKESIGNRYRNCFVAPEGWSFVSSDFNSQELVVIATISNDPVWMDALKHGYDLHSICADLVFGDKWKDAAEDGCAYFAHKQKCKCKAHKTMRTTVKTINFGLAYGMSAHKLSATMQISMKEAEKLIDKYFTVFPNIGDKLKQLGMFGMLKGYIITPPPFKRRRWFAKGPTDREEVVKFVQGSYKKDLGIIERASKNTPIQGGSGDMTKVALVKMRRHINNNNLRDRVKLVMQVHDQIDTICITKFAEEWKKVMTTIMEDAAKVIITSGLLTSETNISEKWEK